MIITLWCGASLLLGLLVGRGLKVLSRHDVNEEWM